VYDLVAEAGSTEATEFAPAMDESTGILPGLPAVAGKPVHVAFDGGRLTSDAGILLLAAIEQRLKIAERLAACLEDRRAPERVVHGLAEMIRYRALLIAAGYPDGNDRDALKSDPAFKMAVGRLPESGEDLCSQPTISRLENLPGTTALKRMMAAMVEPFCDSFEAVPRRILLDIDDTEDRVHGGQQLSLWNTDYDSRCFLPIPIYEATTGKPVAVILRPGKTPDGAEVAMVLRHVIGRIRARWPAVEIPRVAAVPRPRAGSVRGDSHYGRPEAMAWCERQRVGYIFGLAGNPVLLRQVGPLAEDAALGRLDGEGDKVRRWGDFRYAAKSWTVERRGIARVEAGSQGADSRFIVTNLPGLPKALYEKLYCQRPSREPDQGAQAPPRLRPHLVPQGHRQPVPSADPHRRLLADADPSRPGTAQLLLARCPVRHDPTVPDQGRRPGDREGHPHQARPAGLLSLPDRLCHARGPNRQAAALGNGAVAPDRTLRRILKPRSPRHRRHRKPRAGPAPEPRLRPPRE
jgi:Transposase DDE domain group 1